MFCWKKRFDSFICLKVENTLFMVFTNVSIRYRYVLATKSKQSSLVGDVPDWVSFYLFLFFFFILNSHRCSTWNFKYTLLLWRRAVKLISQAIYQAKPINRLNLIPCAWTATLVIGSHRTHSRTPNVKIKLNKYRISCTVSDTHPLSHTL